MLSLRPMRSTASTISPDLGIGMLEKAGEHFRHPARSIAVAHPPSKSSRPEWNQAAA